ncbi:MAG: KpsF/GutQ family sugar-phosphate isomerase [Thermoguttaceae bacterium]|nr:KpsF/GutQ family sugar-phosphate isomerase [Thermoguttaceae bacterium]
MSHPVLKIAELTNRSYDASTRVEGSLALAPETRPRTRSDEDALEFARGVLRSESDAILAQIERLDDDFCVALDMIASCRGYVVVTGMGKAGLIGRKLSATMSSTGTPSHFLHPGEAFHGDLGSIRPGDVVLALSYSGETEEIKRILAPISSRNIPIVSIVSSRLSSLGRASTAVLEVGKIEEADALRLAPSSSAAAMLAVGDALALAVSREKGFRSEDFARFHPGGSLGRQLSRVDECMRPIEQCRSASDSATVRDVFSSCRKPGRRSGAILLTNERGTLTGIFTDSDLAKLFETRGENAFDKPICDVMTKTPSVVESGVLMKEAVALMASRKISELPVVDREGKALGLIDITDLGDFFPTGK